MNMRWAIGATAGCVIMVWCTTGTCGVVELGGGVHGGGVVLSGVVTRTPGPIRKGEDILLQVGCEICSDVTGSDCLPGDYYDGGTTGAKVRKTSIVFWPTRSVEYWVNAVVARNHPQLSFSGVCHRNLKMYPGAKGAYAKMVIGVMDCYTCTRDGWDHAEILDASGGTQSIAVVGGPGDRYVKHWEGVSRLKMGEYGHAKVWHADRLRLGKFGEYGTIVKVLETAGAQGVQVSLNGDVDKLECRYHDTAGPVVYPGPKVVMLKNQEGIVCENALGSKGEQVGSITVDVSVL